ncbi:hypothetical protein [Oceanobacillus jeddahense]|uniref:hypothetical protein n=1 Tax=Oceanobacillus jeddahense TaxID=1462527 RepID=UPI00363DDD9B
MSELLTTGQMIDKLEKGEIAECIQGDNKGAKVYYSKVPGHKRLLVEHSVTLIEDIFNLCDYHKNSFWIIYPRYVSYVEAIKALKAGYTVRCYPEGDDGGYIEFNEADSLYSVANSWTGMTWGSFLASKWTIEG